MAMTHTRGGYVRGCRCDQCKQAESDDQRARRCRQREQVGHGAPHQLGPVEAGVRAEIAGLSGARPGLAQIALELARLMDNPRAVSSKPAAARVLTSLLDKLRSAAAGGPFGHLAAVRTMSKNGGA